MTHEHSNEPLYVTELKAELWSLRDSIAHQNRLLTTLTHAVNQGFTQMTAATDRLTASVQANTDATNAAIAAGIGGSGGSGGSAATEAAVNAQSDIIDANTAALKAATPAGTPTTVPVTPVAPVPTPEPRVGF